MALEDMRETARALVAPGKGVLAADESTPTMAKRLAGIGLESTEARRRTYREILFGTDGLSEHISGVILFDETVRQQDGAGTPFPELLRQRGIIPGIKVDRGLLFVSGGATGAAYVYDADSGAEVAAFDLTDGPAFINDVTVTRDVAWFTNSQAAELYRVALGAGGVPTGAVQTIPLTGDWQQVAGFNANGIAATPDGQTLLVINSTTGILYAVDAATGEATAVDAGGALLTQGDGILLQGTTLWVVRNRSNEVVVLRMASDWHAATPVRTITDPDFDVPTTVAAQGSRLYAVNARFNTPPTPDTEYDIVLVDGR